MLDDLAREHPHLKGYLKAYHKESGRLPLYRETLEADDEAVWGDVLYPAGNGLFIHVRPESGTRTYRAVEPRLTEEEVKILAGVREVVFDEALYQDAPPSRAALEAELSALFDAAVAKRRLDLEEDRAAALRYHLVRDVARYGPLEPLLKDPHLEDVQGVGTGPLHVVHKFYGMLPTNVRFPDAGTLDRYLRNLSERVGRPVSDSRPIVDATLQDGSRINIVYSDDVSRRGPSFSIRRVHADPLSITQLIAWGTLSPMIGAYLWICLENSMSIFFCGEAACGKTTTLNGCLPFINPRYKVYTAEDTPEVRPPHAVWQRLLTRETGPEEARVKMFDLLKAALRSRPNYIVVGEIRGAEGAVAFQAMQTGHPTVASFHASNKVKMVQRLTSEPIQIPVTFLDNLNVAVFQQALWRNGRLLRRVTSVDEIEGYSAHDGGVMTRPVFVYDATNDVHVFKGHNNSYILERKIAEQHGFPDPRAIYDELALRARVLEGMVRHGILGHSAVNEVLLAYADRGAEALPFSLEEAAAAE